MNLESIKVLKNYLPQSSIASVVDAAEAMPAVGLEGVDRATTSGRCP
jgi:hypothetical protein